jgi:hypothetical protein
MVRLVPTVHLSWVKISIVSKWIKTSFRLSLITKEYHWVRPKWLLNLWYVWCKSCTYLESRLTLSPNRPKWASTWASSPRSATRCIQNDFWPYGVYDTNHAPTLTPSPNGPKQDSTWPTSPRSSIRCIQNDFWAHGTFSANCAPYIKISTISKMEWNELPLEPRNIGVQSGVSKTISKPMVHLAQTMHLSCSDTNTISEVTKMRFHKSHVT